ncbi:hypothetical protein LXD69_02795 [Flavobacterium sediminilitoris]|uniref:Lipoprotein n=1 Tax=Flavobacterium sediminilitoris TaxID=2024526 RepID=A0ABY4HP91_9FLAO|nr:MULTISPECIES: hypothetical protein [Flavobacterium]UOX34446.1 hypothetical protein LXD69_02795 [Flavobacterium sediminilitoris]
MKKLIYFIILLFLSCKSKDCIKKDNSLVIEFNNNLDIVKRIHDRNPNDSITIDSYKNAIKYLYQKTNIMSKSDYSSTIGYLDDNDYNNDMKLWKKWLKENSCLQ